MNYQIGTIPTKGGTKCTTLLEYKPNTIIIQNTETMELIEITYDELTNYSFQ